MRYGHVTNGVIDKGPCSLPKSWENVSGLNNMSDAQLRDIGWLPWVFVETPVGTNQVVSGSTVQIQPNQIVETQTVRNLTQQEIDGINKQKQDENKQIAEEKLAATDWTQVADVPLLNKQAFVDYRAAVRAIALNPPVQATFPDLPVEQWT
jgi:hypothetical protein